MTFHFLDVGQGDCSIIQHPSGRVTMIDCNLARRSSPNSFADLFGADPGLRGYFRQTYDSENPIAYMRARNISSLHRFVLSHPDMDHMDGIKDVFREFQPPNFWDTNNTKPCPPFPANLSRYREEDWQFYEQLRAGRVAGVTRLALHSGDRGVYFNADDYGQLGDNLHVLAPTPVLVRYANWSLDFNDCSYVVLYSTPVGRIVIAGDSHDSTWDYILADPYLRALVTDIQLLVAPHHGRHSDRSFKFLDVLRPRVTLFGNAPSEHLAYQPWSYRDLMVITNYRAGAVIADTSGQQMHLFATKQTYAQGLNAGTFFHPTLKAWHLGAITPHAARAA